MKGLKTAVLPRSLSDGSRHVLNDQNLWPSPMSPDTRTSIFGLTSIELIDDEENTNTPLIEG